MAHRYTLTYLGYTISVNVITGLCVVTSPSAERVGEAISVAQAKLLVDDHADAQAH